MRVGAWEGLEAGLRRRKEGRSDVILFQLKIYILKNGCKTGYDNLKQERISAPNYSQAFNKLFCRYKWCLRETSTGDWLKKERLLD